MSARESDREAAFALCPSLAKISAELEAYEALLRAWQKKINLVSAPTLDSLWQRHFADSARLIELFPNLHRWADLGSGAGFPGMVVALLLKSQPSAVVHLIESDQRKAAFLRAVSRETAAPAVVHVARIEEKLPSLLGAVDAISARALAPLTQLIAWSEEHLLKSAVGVFLKGEEWRSELTAAEAKVNFQLRAVGSRTNRHARIIIVAKDFHASGQAFGGQFLD